MSWHYKWETGDPMRVLMRRQEEQANREARMEKRFAAFMCGVKMTKEQSEDIEELLMGWFRWSLAYRVALGAPRVTPYGRNIEPEKGNVYDSDLADEIIERDRAQQVEACLDGLSGIHRSVVGLHFANKHAGAQVYRNPRLSSEATHRIYQEAKGLLLAPLVKRGLVRRE